MDAQWSIGLAVTYFTSPDHLAVLDWIHATFLYPDTIDPAELPVYIILFYESVVGYMPLSIPCTRLMTAISFANPALPYVLTAYLVLQSINSTAMMPIMSGINTHPWSNCTCMFYRCWSTSSMNFLCICYPGHPSFVYFCSAQYMLTTIRTSVPLYLWFSCQLINFSSPPSVFYHMQLR